MFFAGSRYKLQKKISGVIKIFDHCKCRLALSAARGN